MYGKEREKKSPVANQQQNVTPTRNMQSTYSLRKSKLEKEKFGNQLAEKKIEEAKQSIKSTATSINAKNNGESAFPSNTSENVQKQIEAYETLQANQTDEINTHQHRPAFRRLKSFKEMTINEKLTYLLNFPKQLPPVPCNITLNNQQVRGFVIEKEEGFVKIKQMDEKIVTLDITSIEEVKMIGM